MIRIALYFSILWLPLILGSRSWVSSNSNPSPNSSTGAVPFKRVTYSTPVTSNSTLNTFSNVVCAAESSGDNSNKEISNDQKPMSGSETKESCIKILQLAGSLQQGEQFQTEYDTLVYYIENCTGIVSSKQAAAAFGSLSVANQNKSDDPLRYPEHLKWLKKVLYYDPDTIYWCEDVLNMLNTFQYFSEEHSGFYGYIEGGITVSRFLADSAHCSKYHDAVYTMIEGGLQRLYQLWRDTVRDSIATPFNPQFPTLEELDLTILRGPQGSVSPAAEMRIGMLTASPNPFGENLELRYELIKSAMVRIDVFDILGKTIYESPQGFKEKGEHQLTIPTQWTPGTYYIRLSTPSGEIKSAKVIKE
jgi:hypothetical protein